MGFKAVETDSRNSDFINLVRLLDADLGYRYGEVQKQYERYNAIELIKDVIVMYDGKESVACGAFKKFDTASIELKRLFVRAEYRRQGLGKLLVGSLEKLAKSQGYEYAILETGIKQHEAISLYKNSGYNVIDSYGQYIGNPNSICMKKKLTAPDMADYNLQIKQEGLSNSLLDSCLDSVKISSDKNSFDTERLTIRRFREDDWKDLYDYLSSTVAVKYEPYGVFNEDACKEEAIKRSHNKAFWAVCLKETGKMIGNVYFQQQEPSGIRSWEIGYVFNPSFYGKGYATESCRRILDHAFNELNAHRVLAMCNPLNTSSWKLLERLGMRREGHLIKNIFFKSNEHGEPIWNDTYEYAVLADEWLSRNK
jgi:ribosomal-protein-alanine N-acetyltransferase